MAYAKNNSGIYAIINTSNGKRYVGSAVCLTKRIAQHKLNLNKEMHSNIILQNAWKKYGAGGFIFIVIERCPIDILLEREQHHIDIKADYNICPTAGNTLGMKHTKEAREKIAETKKHLGPETHARMSAAHKGKQVGEENPNFGRKHTLESLAKIGAASMGRATFLGKKHTDEAKRKMSERKTGVKLSDKTRSKMSASHTGKKHTKETLEKLSAALKGRKISNETRTKISESAKGRTWSDEIRRKRESYHHSPETLVKMSMSMKGKVPHNKGVCGIYHHSEETRALMSVKIKAALAARIVENMGVE